MSEIHFVGKTRYEDLIETGFNTGWQGIEEDCHALLKSVRGVGNN